MPVREREAGNPIEYFLQHKRRPHIMNDSHRVHVGGYEAWMENGMLTFQYHKVGRQNGTSVKMSPDETMGLLELLYQNRDSVYGAVGGEEYARHRQEVQAALSQDLHHV
jgi:hypothetical protein